MNRETHSAISVAIVSYNTRAHLQACLESVMAQQPAGVIVVDNSSTDGSRELVKTHFPQVRLITNANNPGYGAALNQAARLCRTPFILFLNSDTILQPLAVDALERYLELHPDVGLVAPRLLNPDGTLQRSCRRVPGTFAWLFDNKRLAPILRTIPFWGGRHCFWNWNHDRSRKTDWVVGAALAVRMKALEDICGFDEAYFMYCEEIDLCCRLWAANWEVHFTPVAEVVHVGGASTASMGPAAAEQVRISTERFYRLHYRGLRRRLLLLSVDPGRGFRALFRGSSTKS